MNSVEYKIKEIFKNKINPQLALHGGSVEFVSYIKGIVRIKMLGSCMNCPSADDTVKNVIESTLINELGKEKIKDIILVNDVSQDLLDMAKKILNKGL